MFVKIENEIYENRIYNVNRINYIKKEIRSPKIANGHKPDDKEYCLVIAWGDGSSSILAFNTPEEANEALKKLVGDIND